MQSLIKLSVAFTAGAVGAVVLMVTRVLMFGMSFSDTDVKVDFYRLIVWGGIWALLLVLPLWRTKWLLRGIMLALTVIIFNFLILMPLNGHGFFASHAGMVVFWSNIGFNTLWALVAALWYRIAVGRK
jgi:hypothetical protein